MAHSRWNSPIGRLFAKWPLSNYWFLNVKMLVKYAPGVIELNVLCECLMLRGYGRKVGMKAL